MQTIQAKPISQEAHIGIICSEFNRSVTEKLLQGTLEKLQENISATNITVVHVPGAIEIPLLAEQLAKSKRYDVIIALGAVIRGETSHYDYVCQQVSQGCQHVALHYDIPVIFGVLTTENGEQAVDRVGGQHGHKGCDAAVAALQMISVMNQVKQKFAVEHS